MDAQSYDAWWAQGNYPMPPHQTAIFELPPDLSKVPSLSGSPVSILTMRYNKVSQSQGVFHIRSVPRCPSTGILSAYCWRSNALWPLPDSHDTTRVWLRSRQPILQSTTTLQCRASLLPHSNTPANVPTSRAGRTTAYHFRSKSFAHIYGRFADSLQRRRAQNRAAQRAFRERKEKHARDLEVELAALNDKYNKLENSHTELNAAYDKLRKTFELLTQDDDADGEDEEGHLSIRRSSNPETLRKLLEIIHGDFKGAAVKKENL